MKKKLEISILQTAFLMLVYTVMAIVSGLLGNEDLVWSFMGMAIICFWFTVAILAFGKEKQNG